MLMFTNGIMRDILFFLEIAVYWERCKAQTYRFSVSVDIVFCQCKMSHMTELLGKTGNNSAHVHHIWPNASPSWEWSMVVSGEERDISGQEPGWICWEQWIQWQLLSQDLIPVIFPWNGSLWTYENCVVPWTYESCIQGDL